MKNLFRKLFIYLPIVLIITICLLYFIVTSGFFLKFIGLPLAGTLTGMPIKVEGITVSFLVNPHLDVSGLILGYAEKPFITGRKVSTRFDLLSLLKGNLKLTNVSIDGLNINMASSRDGKWNVCWMNGASSANTSNSRSENAKTGLSSSMQMDITEVSIQNVNFTLNIEDDINVILKNFDIHSDSFKNQQESSVKIKGDIEQFTGKNVTIKNGKVDTILRTNLSEEYFPTFLQLDSVISDFTGIVKDKAISNRSFKINARLSPEDKNVVNVSNISIKEYVGDAAFSSLVSKGKITLAPFAFDLNISADPIGSDTINFVTNSFLHADMGNDASLVFKGDVSFANDLLTAKGDLKLANSLLLSLVSSTTKDLISATFKYNIAADFSARKTDIKQLEIAIDRNAEIINMALKKPASIAWDNDQIKMTGEDPEIIAKVSNLKLGILNGFLPVGAEFISGVISSNLNLKIGANGANISVFGNINLADASYTSSDFSVNGVGLNQAVNLTLSDKKYLAVKKYCISLTQNGQELLKSSFKGKHDFGSGDGEVEASIPYYSLATINMLPDTILSREGKEQLINKLSPFSFTIDNRQVFNVKGKTITVKDFLLDLQTEKKETISLTLDKSLKLDLNDARLIPEGLSLKLKASGLELKNLNNLLQENTKIENGKVSIDATLNATNMFEKISASGTVIAADVSGKLNGNTLNNTGINTNFNITYKEAGAFTLTDTIVKLFCGSNDAASISVNGTLDDAGSMNLETQFRVNENLLKTLNKTGPDYEKVGAFLLDGSLRLKTANDAFSVDGNINIPKLIITDKQSSQTEQINGLLDLSIRKNSQCLDINSAKLNLYSNRSNICDLTGRGKVIFSGNTQSNFDLSSGKIDLEKILRVYGLLFPSTQGLNGAKNKAAAASQTQEKEPDPIDLHGINLKGNISLKDVQYGPFIHMAIDSDLIIENNIIALLPLTAKMNQGEIKSSVNINTSFADGYTYEIKSQLKNIDINPLLRTFLEGNYSDTKGLISSLQFNASGKGVTSQNLLNNLNSNLVASCKNISLPLDISKNKFLALFFISIQIISNISQQLPNTPLPSNLSQAMDLTSNIMTQNKNINFQTGDVALKMNNGVVNIEKFYFVGGDKDIIKTMKFGGTIGPDNKLKLKTNTNFGKFDIPLNFYGTVEKPKPDIPAFIAGFIAKNTINILDVTQGILNSAVPPQQQQQHGTGDSTKQAGNVILDDIFGNSNSTSPPKGSGEPVQQLGNIIFDTAKDILGNLTTP